MAERNLLGAQTGPLPSPLRPTQQRMFMWLLHDLTERKRAEHQIRGPRDELETRVRQRTIELTAANEAANRAKAMFLADLILLDMELPKKSGQGLLSEIRADPRLPGIPIVVWTSSLVHKAVLQARGLRVDGYMTKPVSWEQFIAVVKSLRRSWLESLLAPMA
jgi:CheY-like chemotaxis protein